MTTMWAPASHRLADVRGCPITDQLQRSFVTHAVAPLRCSHRYDQIEPRQTQCDETYAVSANAAGIAKLSRIRFVSAAGVRPNRRLNSLLN